MYNRQLEAFVNAAECRSFTKAAAKKYITTAALIQQINSLEERTGITLFFRTHSGVRLTPGGEILYHYARKMMEESRDAIRQAQEANHMKDKVIRIGTTAMNRCRYLPELCSRLHREDPSWQVQFVNMENIIPDQRHYLDNLLNGDVDMFESINYPGAYEGSAGFVTLTETPLCLAVPQKHRLYDREKLSVSDLKNELVYVYRMCDVEKNFNGARDCLRKQSGDEFVEELPYYDLEIIDMAEYRNTPILVAEIWKDVLRSFRLIPIDWNYKAQYGIVYSPDANETVMEFLKRTGCLD